MACFLVPAAEAAATSVAKKVIDSKEKKNGKASESNTPEEGSVSRFSFSRKLKWLTNLLWGGTALLAFEHIWHGEVVPFFPFLTAASNPEDAAEMLHEMSTTGVAMAVAVTLVWVAMVAVSTVIEKRNMKPGKAENDRKE